MALSDIKKFFSNNSLTAGSALSTGLPYKVYTALLTQSGTDAPVAIVFENNLGGIPVWSRNGVGELQSNFSGSV